MPELVRSCILCLTQTIIIMVPRLVYMVFLKCGFEEVELRLVETTSKLPNWCFKA